LMAVQEWPIEIFGPDISIYQGDMMVA